MSKMKFGLGKGLGALLPSEDTDAERVSVTPTPETRDDGRSVGILAHVDVSKIRPNPYQPRAEFEPDALRELAQSIRENGLVQPITVRRHEDGYQLISGERRVRACQEAGITHIPAYIRKVDTAQEMIELALIENIQREMLNPIEIALAYQRLIDECNHTQDQVAQKVGKNRTTVSNFIRLLRLPEEIQKSIRKGETSFGHARALIGLQDERVQMRIWQRTLRENLSVRAVEELARRATLPPAVEAPKKKRTPPTPDSAQEFIEKLRGLYGTQIHIVANRKGKGTVTFEFYSHEDFERIFELLSR